MGDWKQRLRRVVSNVRETRSPSPPAQNEETAPTEPAEMEFRPKRTQFRDLIETNGGRMKQSELVSETEWSAATVSRVLGEMEDDGIVEKIPLGRTNVIALRDAEPDWYTPPDGQSASNGPRRAQDAVSDDAAAILLIEDDTQDANLLKRAFSEAGVPNPIHTVRDGLDAIKFLERRGQFANAPTPALVLLDLGLLVVDGFEVLRELDEGTVDRGIPIIVLSHSDDPGDIRRSYDNGATAYLTKPGSLDGFIDLIDAIDAFWLSNEFKPQPPSQGSTDERQRTPASE